MGLFQADRIHVGESSAILNPKDLEETYGVPMSVYEEPTGALCVRMERKGEGQ